MPDNLSHWEQIYQQMPLIGATQPRYASTGRPAFMLRSPVRLPDAASQRICVVDANNGRSTTIFSNRGYVSATEDQLGVFTSFTQDANGNTILRVDGRNWPTTYTIDALNRTKQTQYIDNTRVTNTWDAAGQLIVSADVTGITSTVWDNDSRKIGTVNPTGIALTSTLDPLGNRLVLADPYGRTTYTWDSQSRLTSIQNPLNERTTMSWDPLNREQHRVLANGGTISHTWDSAGQETLIENRNTAGVGQFIATNTYSPVDTRLTVLELDNTHVTYSYDAASQIIYEARSGTYAYARSYIWDPNGNRLQQYDNGVLTTSTFNKANQLLVQTPTTGNATVSSYDGAGNLIGMNCGGALTTQAWSPENRLTSYGDAAGNSEQFLYSNDGLKKKRVNGTATTLFTYDESALLLETDTSLNLDARYTNSPETWGGLASQSRSGVSSFYGLDSQQCARILVSMAGVITDSYSYKAFGEELQSGSGTVNPYRYIANGLYYFELVDLINAWNRWLNPSVGRWDSRDRLGFDGKIWNVFQVATNNPVIISDPSGNEPQVDPKCYSSVPQYDGIDRQIQCFCNALSDGGGVTYDRIVTCIRKTIKGISGSDVTSALDCMARWCAVGKDIGCSDGSDGNCKPDQTNKVRCNPHCNCQKNCTCCPKRIAVPGCAEDDCGSGRRPGTINIRVCTFWTNGQFKRTCPNAPYFNCESPTDQRSVWAHELSHFCVPGQCDVNANPNAESNVNALQDCISQICP